MSREERRAYKRMMKNADPYALPASAAAKARDERQRARRQRMAAVSSGRPSGRFWWWAIGGGLLAGLLGFSVAWPQMPFALLVGGAVALAWAGLAVGLRALASRRAPPAG